MRWCGSTGPLFSHFYYHPCLNYSVAAISITAAILYLAPPMLTASTFHSKYSANIPDKRKEAAAQNQVQLVTKKKKKKKKRFFFLPSFRFWNHKTNVSSAPNRKKKKRSIILISMANWQILMAFGKKKLPHIYRCAISYHPVSFVTISCNMKDPSSHLGGLICWRAIGAGLSRLELQWWKQSMLFSFTECKIKTFCIAGAADPYEPLCCDTF